MRRILFWFALTPLLVTPLLADWKIVTINDGHTTTEYYKRASLRSDASPVYTTVADFDHRKQITWRTDLRQYTVLDWPPLPPSADPSSQPVIKIESTTTDTGERKKFFGRTARHLITRTVRDGLETQTDGWYIDAPGLPKWKRGGTAIMVLTSSLGNQKAVTPRIDFKQTGPPPEGLPVVLKTTSHIAIPGAPAHTFENSSQVIELDEAPLPDRLFQPPSGYQRVDQLSTAANPTPRHWADYAQYEWRRMQAWINSLFNARKSRAASLRGRINPVVLAKRSRIRRSRPWHPQTVRKTEGQLLPGCLGRLSFRQARYQVSRWRGGRYACLLVSLRATPDRPCFA